MIVTDAKEKRKEWGQTDPGASGAFSPITSIIPRDHPILALTRRRYAVDLDHDIVVAAVTSEVEGDPDPTTSAIFAANQAIFSNNAQQKYKQGDLQYYKCAKQNKFIMRDLHKYFRSTGDMYTYYREPVICNDNEHVTPGVKEDKEAFEAVCDW